LQAKITLLLLLLVTSAAPALAPSARPSDRGLRISKKQFPLMPQFFSKDLKRIYVRHVLRQKTP